MLTLAGRILGALLRGALSAAAALALGMVALNLLAAGPAAALVRPAAILLLFGLVPLGFVLAAARGLAGLRRPAPA